MYRIDLNNLNLSIVPIELRDRVAENLITIHSLVRNDSYNDEIFEIISLNSNENDIINYFVLIVILNSEIEKFYQCKGSAVSLKILLEDFRDSEVLFCDGGEFLYDVTTMLDHGEDPEFQAIVRDMMSKFTGIALQAALSNRIGQALR